MCFFLMSKGITFIILCVQVQQDDEEMVLMQRELFLSSGIKLISIFNMKSGDLNQGAARHRCIYKEFCCKNQMVPFKKQTKNKCSILILSLSLLSAPPPAPLWATPINPATWKHQLQRAQDQEPFIKARMPSLMLVQLKLCQVHYISTYTLPFDVQKKD